MSCSDWMFFCSFNRNKLKKVFLDLAKNRLTNTARISGEEKNIKLDLPVLNSILDADKTIDFGYNLSISLNSKKKEILDITLYYCSDGNKISKEFIELLKILGKNDLESPFEIEDEAAGPEPIYRGKFDWDYIKNILFLKWNGS